MTRLLTVLVLLLCLWPAAAARAADPPDPGKTTTGKTVSGGNEYDWIEYVPSSVSSKKAAPLLVMIHGCQTTAEQEMRFTLFNTLAERERFVVLYPDVDEEGRNQPGPLRQCWKFLETDAYDRGKGDPAAIVEMTRGSMARNTIDPERVYAVGASAGGLMTGALAAAYPDIYAAVGIVVSSAYADAGCFATGTGIPAATSAQMARDEMGSRARVVPRISMGSDADQAFPAPCTEKANEQGLRTSNLVLGDSQTTPISLSPAAVREEKKEGGIPATVSTYRDPAKCVIAERWIIHGMPHAWPGGTTDTKYKGFVDPRAPDGAEATWAFLERYRKSDTAMPCAQAPCPKRTLSIRLPAGTVSASATVDGKRVTSRIKRGALLVTVPAGIREATSVKIRARKASGRKVTRRSTYGGCGPA